MGLQARVCRRKGGGWGLQADLSRGFQGPRTSQGEGDEADHLVQGNASVHHCAGGIQRHGVIHVLVHQPESNGFVTNQRLCQHDIC